jgi:hypothetical protein
VINIFLLLGSESRFLGRHVCSLVTILTELLWLLGTKKERKNKTGGVELGVITAVNEYYCLVLCYAVLSSGKVHRRFGGTYCLHLQSLLAVCFLFIISFIHASICKRKSICSSETSINFYRTTRRHPKDINLWRKRGFNWLPWHTAFFLYVSNLVILLISINIGIWSVLCVLKLRCDLLNYGRLSLGWPDCPLPLW